MQRAAIVLRMFPTTSIPNLKLLLPCNVLRFFVFNEQQYVGYNVTNDHDVCVKGPKLIFLLKVKLKTQNNITTMSYNNNMSHKRLPITNNVLFRLC